MQPGKSNQQQLLDKREGFRVKIRREKWRKTLEQQRSHNLSVSGVQTLLRMMEEHLRVSELGRFIQSASMPMAVAMQNQVAEDIFNRLLELRQDDLSTIGLLQLKTKRVEEPILKRLLEILSDADTASMSKQYLNRCISYLSVCAQILTHQKSGQQLLLDIFLLFMKWWNDGFDFNPEELYRFLLAMQSFCSRDATLNDNFMSVTIFVVGIQLNQEFLPRSLLHVVLLAVEIDQQDFIKDTSTRSHQQKQIRRLVEDCKCISRVLRGLEYEPLTTLAILLHLSENESYQERLLAPDIEYNWLEKCCCLVEDSQYTILVLDVFINFAVHEQGTQAILRSDRLMKVITSSSMVTEHRPKVTQLCAFLAYFAENETQLKLLQEFDVLSVIVKELEWNEENWELVELCLDIMKYITESNVIPGVVRELFELAQQKAMLSQEARFEKILEEIRANIAASGDHEEKMTN